MAGQPSRVWKCGCGKVELKLTGDPWFNGNCHCHSCVASGRFIDEKHASADHTSGIVDKGACFSFVSPKHVEPVTELSPDLFGCVKVGPKGKPQRIYVKCCGTQLGMVQPAFWGLNRNAIYEEDGSTKYAPAKPPKNIMKNHAFNPEEVPEPSDGMMAFGDMVTVMGAFMNPFSKKIDKEIIKNTTPDPASAEEVPITWE